MTTVRYRFSESEAIQGIIKVRRWNHPWESVKGAVAGGIGATLPVAAYLFHRGNAFRMNWMVIYGCIYAVCILPIAYLLVLLWMRRSIVNVVQRNRTRYTSPEELSFDEKSLALVSASQRQEFTWTVFPRRRQDKNNFYLFSGAGGVFAIVPKRAFDAASLAEFIRCGQFPQSV